MQDPKFEKSKILYDQSRFTEALNVALDVKNATIKTFEYQLHLGNIYFELNEHNSAIKCFKRSIKIKNHKYALINLANVYYQKKDFGEALKFTQKAYKLNSKDESLAIRVAQLHMELLDNQAALEVLSMYEKSVHFISADYQVSKTSILINMKRYSEAALAANAALKLNPSDRISNKNKVIISWRLGDVQGSISHALSALKINENDNELFFFIHSLHVQLPHLNVKLPKFSETRKGAIMSGPHFVVLALINQFIKGDMSSCLKLLRYVKQIQNNGALSQINETDRKFFIAYSGLINKLLPYFEELNGCSRNVVYHIGESHCLTFAHHELTLDGIKYKVEPRIIFGAKAFHLGDKKMNQYKALFRLNIQATPKHAKILCSFGEIDCRDNEGIILHCRKTGKTLLDVTKQTVTNYLSFITEIMGERPDISVTLLNVPAPKKLSYLNDEDALALRSVVSHFNEFLSDFAGKTSIKILDQYSLTKNEIGFSNNRHHCDSRHLGPTIIQRINTF